MKQEVKTANIKTSKKKLPSARSGKLLVDGEFAEHLAELSKTYTFNIENPTHLKNILQRYREFLLEKYSSNPLPKKVLNIMGIELESGFNLLYGAPDTLKTTIAINMANRANAMGLKVMFVDTENKMIDGALDDGIYYMKGTTNADHHLRSLYMIDSIDFYIIDTIYSLSSTDKFIRNAQKFIKPQGNFVLMVNQTRSWRFGQYSCGPDIIDEIAINRYRLLSRKQSGKKTYIRSDADQHLVFDDPLEGKLVPTYDPGTSLLRKALGTGTALKLGKQYKYEDTMYSRPELISFLLEQSPGDVIIDNNDNN